jgi:hypothetical protein
MALEFRRPEHIQRNGKSYGNTERQWKEDQGGQPWIWPHDEQDHSSQPRSRPPSPFLPLFRNREVLTTAATAERANSNILSGLLDVALRANGHLPTHRGLPSWWRKACTGVKVKAYLTGFTSTGTRSVRRRHHKAIAIARKVAAQHLCDSPSQPMVRGIPTLIIILENAANHGRSRRYFSLPPRRRLEAGPLRRHDVGATARVRAT